MASRPTIPLKPPKPPRALLAPSRAFWRAVVDEFRLEQWQLLLLTQACAELDRCTEADRLWRKEGMIIRGGDGRKYPHPSVLIARDARSAFARMVKQLGLDIEPTNQNIGRPARGAV